MQATNSLRRRSLACRPMRRGLLHRPVTGITVMRRATRMRRIRAIRTQLIRCVSACGSYSRISVPTRPCSPLPTILRPASVPAFPNPTSTTNTLSNSLQKVKICIKARQSLALHKSSASESNFERQTIATSHLLSLHKKL